MPGELPFWLALHRVRGLGPRCFFALLDAFGGPAAVFEAGDREWRRLAVPASVRAGLRAPDWAGVHRDLEWTRGERCAILVHGDPRYPYLLRQIADPPPVLFVCGDPAALARAQLAVVGTRTPTPAGIETARAFAEALVRRDLAITSGLALGIDAAGHEAALTAGGVAIAVAGTGPERIYPARHRALAGRVVAAGALVTEFPTGTPVRPEHFPRRNRIISGLSLGVLVVEAAGRSGSLITARAAAEQGREVFAVPGSIRNPLARGCHALIREGATLVETADHVIEELGALAGLLSAGDTEARTDRAGTKEVDDLLEGEYAALLQAMGYDVVTVDILVERAGLTAEAVSSMLLRLELQGHVAMVAGGQYCRCGRG